MGAENKPSILREAVYVPGKVLMVGGGLAGALAYIGLVNPTLLMPALSTMVLGGVGLGVTEAIFPRKKYN
jgi:hypothetical protein